jgi:hypothetical protein
VEDDLLRYNPGIDSREYRIPRKNPSDLVVNSTLDFS